MPPLEAQGLAARRVLGALAACALLWGCTGSPTTTESPLPTPPAATDEGSEATDSALSGTVMPQVNF